MTKNVYWIAVLPIFLSMDKTALLYAIRASEGRVMVSETIAIT